MKNGRKKRHTVHERPECEETRKKTEADGRKEDNRTGSFHAGAFKNRLRRAAGISHRRFLAGVLIICSLNSLAKTERFEIPSGATTLENEAFRGCGEITEISIPEGVESIGAGCFAECGKLRDVWVPSSVAEIGEGAFPLGYGPLLIRTEAGSAAVDYALREGIDFSADGRFRALLIGECSYRTMGTLNGPETDTMAMSKVISRFWESRRSLVNVRMNLTAAGIRDAIAETFRDAGKEDISLLYFSGHGGESVNKALAGALMGVDGDYLTAAELRNLLDQVPGRKIVILDACFSGNMINRGKSMTEGFSKAVVAVFSAGSEKTDNENLAADRYYVMTAAHSTETSIEYTMEGKIFGLFTYALCLGCGYNLVSGAYGTAEADGDRDGVITLQEAYRYAMITAARYNSRQTAQVWPAQCVSFGLFR